MLNWFGVEDVDYENCIVRTAQRIFDFGLDGIEKHSNGSKEIANKTGNHLNALLFITKSDFHSAEILVRNGLGDSELMRVGMWKIAGKYTYFTKSNKWSTINGNTYRAQNLESFIQKYVLGDKTFCKVDKK